MVVASDQTLPSSADDDKFEQLELEAATTTTNNTKDETQLSRNQSRASRASQSIHRVRSQNGYGVDDAAPEDDVEQHHGPAEKDEFEVGWDGGDSDPLCPRSFGKARKWMIALIAVGASFCVTCASSIYTSTYQQLEAEFHNSRIVSVLGLSSFVLGISLGPMFFGPLSEFYGRRPIYLVSWSLFVIWIIPQAVCQNIQTMIVSRFLNAFAGSTFLAVSGGTVGDLFAQHELPAPMALFTIAPFIGPSVGPLIGGFINYYTDWRWTFYVLLIWAFSLLVAIAVLVPETYHPIILRKKAKKMREQTGDDRWHGPGEKAQRSVLAAVGHSLLRPFQLLTFEFMVLNLCIYSAILLGILYLFFGVFPLVFRENHGFNLWQVGFTFVGLGVGMVAGVMTYPLWHRMRMQLIAKTEQGQSEPEFRLPSVIMGSILVPIGLFMFGWTTYPSVHWIVPIIGSAIFGAGTTMSYSGIFTFLVDAYPAYAASALAANTFVRCLFATAFPLFGNQMFETLGYPWATSLLGFLTVAMMPFPYIFFRYGKKWRAKSRYARS